VLSQIEIEVVEDDEFVDEDVEDEDE
jgi:hypothetical protein